MNRMAAAFAGMTILLAIALVILFSQNRRLQSDLLAAKNDKAAAPPTAPEADPALAKEQKRADELAKKVTELETSLAEAKKEAGKKKDPDKAKDPADVAKDPDKDDPARARMMEIMKKLGKVLPLGEDITEAAAKELGLEAGQVTAVNLASKDEAKRIAEALQRFYAEHFNAQEEGLYEKPGNELMRLMLGKVMGEVMELSKLPQEKAMGIHTGETSLEELLGPDKVASKLAAVLHAQRLKTYETLATSLTPEQLARFRDEFWREGSIYYPNNEHYEFGMAPKEMKK